MKVSSNRDSRRREFLRSVLLCFISILMNVTGAFLADRLGSSLYMDSIGTVFAAAVGGFLPGTITGFFSNLCKGLWDLNAVYYIPVSIAFALVTSFFARRNDLLRFPHMLFPWVCLALVGGGLGSVLTWYLSGAVFAGAPLAERLTAFGLTPFSAQLVHDFLLDLADKGITLLAVILILRLIPGSVRQAFSRRSLSLRRDGDAVRRRSLRTKVMFMIAGLMTIVAISVTWITLSQFHDSMIQENANLACSAARVARGAFDADRVNEYLQLGEAAEGYRESEAQLLRIVESSEDIEYVYVYQIREDGCHVVFDPDTPAGPGDDPGEVVAFDEAFESMLDTLLAGGEIDPVISNEKFGWLLSVYLPVFDSDGVCQCYIGVDLSMPRLTLTEHIFQTRMISLFLGFTMLLSALGIQLVEDALVRPINSMAAATAAFAGRGDDTPAVRLAAIKALDIRTGDELENLYQAISSTTREVVQNIEDIQHKNRQITRLQSGLIMVLADMVESRDKCTGNHVRNTASYVRLILNKLREEGLFPDILTDEYIEDVVSSAPLHDVGKITVPDALLNKPGKLTVEEFTLMKQHTVAGGEIIDSAIEQVADSDSLYLNEARKLTLYHHERWDGRGYPFGIKGEEIPLSARVMAVADVFDALVSRRSYKEGYPVDKAISIISEESGTHFDPVVVDAFLRCRDEAEKIAEAANRRNAKAY